MTLTHNSKFKWIDIINQLPLMEDRKPKYQLLELWLEEYNKSGTRVSSTRPNSYHLGLGFILYKYKICFS